MKGGKGLEGGDVGWQESSAASCTTPGGPFKSFTDWNGAGMIVFFCGRLSHQRCQNGFSGGSCGES